MELYTLILADYYAKYSGLESRIDSTAIVRDRCYQAICRIRQILADDMLEDVECFRQIEEILCTLEDLGIDGGTRHDFG